MSRSATALLAVSHAHPKLEFRIYKIGFTLSIPQKRPSHRHFQRSTNSLGGKKKKKKAHK